MDRMDSADRAQVAVESLDSLGNVLCDVAQTDEPWLLDIDAIVLSVGTSFGGLAQAVRRQLPASDWDRIDLASINQLAPLGLVLKPLNSLDAPAIGVPLVGAGELGLDPSSVAPVVMRNAIDAFQSENEGQHRIVFLAKTDEDLSAILSAWSRVSLPPTTDSTVELAGGVTSDLVDPNRDIPSTRDQLGVTPFVSMLATVIVDRHTPPPLSVESSENGDRARATSWDYCAVR